MERIYRLIVNQEDLTEAENKLDNEEVNVLEFEDFREDYIEITDKPMFELSDNSFIVVSDEEVLGRLIAFMFRGGVKTTRIDDVTDDVFYNKIDLVGADEKFEEAIKNCLLSLFEEDDVFEKMKKLGGEKHLTKTDKLIIEKTR